MNQDSGHRKASSRRGRKRLLWIVALITMMVVGLRSSLVNTKLDAGAGRTLTNNNSLFLEVIDEQTGKNTPARFELVVDGKPYYPEELGSGGLRFVSVHESKKQTLIVTYAKGKGPVEIDLPKNARRVEVHVAKGFEYLPASITQDLSDEPMRIRVELRRWIDMSQKGWLPTDEHVHYDRLGPTENADWLTMLAGDGLQQAHFMVLKGGKVPGVWARQYAFGKQGEAFDGQRLIRSGEEYRDSAQGHIVLLGITEIIQPISTGGLGDPPVPFEYPPLHDVFERSRQLGGLGGVAHGGSLGRRPTAIVDTVLGVVDFFEIANAHLYSHDLWYRLMNCGYDLPPAAGTDLPNYPNRDPWQPFLGSMRMYVKVDRKRDFESWKAAVLRNEVFVTSGPMLEFSVEGVGPGRLLRLPDGGGEVTLEAVISTPIGLRKLEIVRNGKVIPADIERSIAGDVHRWRIRRRVRITKSCWLAARGEGLPIEALQRTQFRQAPWINTSVVVHTAAIPIEVGGRPIRSAEDTAYLVRLLRQQQEYYRTKGRYQKGEHRLRVQQLFEEAVKTLDQRLREDR